MAETKIYFGVALELAGKTIALEPKNAIDEIKQKGIEVGLPPGERVYLGTVGQSLGKIFASLGVGPETTDKFLNADGSLKESELPDITALKTAAKLVLEAGLFVDEFHVKIPGAAAGTAPTLPAAGTPAAPASSPAAGPISVASKEKTAYTVGLSAEWQQNAGQLIDGLDLKLRGIYFKVSNEE